MRSTSSLKPVHITESELLDLLFNEAFKSGFSLAAWKLPDENTTQIILSKKPERLAADALLEELPAGFIFAPFDRDSESLFLGADIKFTVENERLVLPRDESEYRSQEWLAEKMKDHNPSVQIKTTYPGKPVIDFSKAHFMSLVEKGLREVETSPLEKVVPSRTKTVSLDSGFEVGKAFLKLSKAYPNAFVSVTSSPETGTWMGASPEELVRVFDKTIFKTVALAGTQPHREGMNLRNVSWTQKEIEEQALVERYIISCFKKIRLREYEEHGPKTTVAGNVLHLKSDFTVNMKETNFPQLGTVMLKLLHPTSAVCGMPLDQAIQFLKEHEGYDRSYYSGFLGPVNLNNQINIFVNLRCMQICNDKAVLYAGAGVTVDSLPEQEWEETEIKMKTLLSVIQ